MISEPFPNWAIAFQLTIPRKTTLCLSKCYRPLGYGLAEGFGRGLHELRHRLRPIPLPRSMPGLPSRTGRWRCPTPAHFPPCMVVQMICNLFKDTYRQLALTDTYAKPKPTGRSGYPPADCRTPGNSPASGNADGADRSQHYSQVLGILLCNLFVTHTNYRRYRKAM